MNNANTLTSFSELEHGKVIYFDFVIQQIV